MMILYCVMLLRTNKKKLFKVNEEIKMKAEFTIVCYFVWQSLKYSSLLVFFSAASSCRCCHSERITPKI